MKKELVLNFIFTVLINLLNFIQNKYFIQCIGIGTFGMVKLFSQLLAYLNIIEMGIGSASAFALYKPLSDKNYNQISIIMNTIESFYKKIGFLLFGLGVLCTPILSFFMKESDLNAEIYFFWILYVINTTLTYLFIKYTILYVANQEFLYVKSIQSISMIFYKFFQVLFIIKFKSIYIYILLLILDNLTQWIIFKKHYQKKYNYIIKVTEKYDNIKNDIKNLFWHKIGGLVVFNTDLIIISKFINLKIVGVYYNYQMICQVSSTIINIFLNVVSPKIGKYIAEHRKQEVYIYFKKYDVLYLFISLILTHCIFILIDSFIVLWLGKNFILSKFTLKLICFNLYVNLFRWNLESFKTGSGFFDDIKSPIYESIINLFFSIILGLNWGLDGIIIGTIISNVSIILIYKPILVFKRCFDKDWKEYIKVYGNYLILVILSLIVLNLIIKPFIVSEINGWIEWIIYATKISSISGIAIFIVFLLNKEFRNILKEYVFNK